MTEPPRFARIGEGKGVAFFGNRCFERVRKRVKAGAGGNDASARLRPHYDHSDAPRRLLPHPHDGRAMRPYDQTFSYDPAGRDAEQERAEIP